MAVAPSPGARSGGYRSLGYASNCCSNVSPSGCRYPWDGIVRTPDGWIGHSGLRPSPDSPRAPVSLRFRAMSPETIDPTELVALSFNASRAAYGWQSAKEEAWNEWRALDKALSEADPDTIEYEVLQTKAWAAEGVATAFSCRWHEEDEAYQALMATAKAAGAFEA